jgi:hypothetical protein
MWCFPIDGLSFDQCRETCHAQLAPLFRSGPLSAAPSLLASRLEVAPPRPSRRFSATKEGRAVLLGKRSHPCANRAGQPFVLCSVPSL